MQFSQSAGILDMEEESLEGPDVSLTSPPVVFIPPPPVLRARTNVSMRVRRTWRHRVHSALEHWMWSLWMTSLTVFALFGDDMRLATTTKASDDGFFAMSSVCLFCFAGELVLASLVKENYVFRFYFWLDLLSTVSLIADIGWVWNLIIGAKGVGQQTAKTSQVLRAGRASRAGARAARIIRAVRVIRLIRIVKLYKIAQQSRIDFSRVVAAGELKRSKVSFRGGQFPLFQMCADPAHEGNPAECEKVSMSYSFEAGKHGEQRNSEEMSNVGTAAPYFRDRTQTQDLKFALNYNDEADEAAAAVTRIPEESIVGKQLSDQISKRTILLVLGVMFALPLFSKDVYIEEDKSFLYGLRLLNRFAGGDMREFDAAWESYIDSHSSIGTPLVYLEVAGSKSWEGDVNYLDLRLEEQEVVQFSGDRFEAALNISKTLLICIILASSTLIFSQDANAMVIGPIERMVQRVKQISKNPLEASHNAIKEAYVIQKVTKKRSKRDGMMETEALEKVIEKMGALLAIGFGEAGSEIIIANMKKGGGDVDPMIPGRKTECIFGFCDIRRFADTTEVLQEDVMHFVNEIAYIVHTTAFHFSGSTNKNIGEAFLLVWKFPANISSEAMNVGQLADRHFCRQMTDMAIMTFMKIWAQIHRNPKILKYRRHIPLNRRLPNYSVNMGFGLHAGWAIEGAIGSEFKIDASYLSPHVNLTSRLEAATRQYGVPILISGKVYQLATSVTRRLFRQIDRVTVKGSKLPVDLFTPDISTQTLVPDNKLPHNEEPLSKDAQRFAMMEQREILKRFIIRDHRQVSFLYEEDPDFIELLREDFTFFKEKFKQAFEHYIQGQWREAGRLLLEAETVLGRTDGPSRTLLAVIEEHGYTSPVDWPGYRELTEK